MNIKLNGWQDFPGPCYDPQARWGDCPATLRDLVLDQRIPVPDRVWAFAHCVLVSDRDKRLFAVRCGRETPTLSGVVMDLITDRRSARALSVAASFALGLASRNDLAAAESAARAAAWSAARRAQLGFIIEQLSDEKL